MAKTEIGGTMADIEEQISEMVKDVERIRESGNVTRALVLLKDAEGKLSLSDYEDEKYDSILSSILGHEAVCYKHLYQNTGDKAYLEKMDHVLYRGMLLKIPDNEKSVFYLRFGDLETCTGDYEKAVEYYQKAYDTVEEGYRRGEFLGHLGDSLTNLGLYGKAIQYLYRALDLADKYPASSEWHQLIIICGHYGRLAKAYKRARDYPKSFAMLWKYWQIASILDKQYGMPQRKKQLYGILRRRKL